LHLRLIPVVLISAPVAMVWYWPRRPAQPSHERAACRCRLYASPAL
jgi:hypothetical protein